MIVLIWTALLFSLRGSVSVTDTLEGAWTSCTSGFCIALNGRETTAEAGLCVVIPCSFTTGNYFTSQNMVWFKCEAFKQKCVESDMIFHSKNKRKSHYGFTGRVSLLEPDISKRNCSIIINDLTESDSGSYQLRVNGYISWSSRSDGFLFWQRAAVSVKGLNQKPVVKIPPLTEGQQATLSCTAPGLCSGSVPNFTWTWQREGANDSLITGNIITFKTEELSTVTQRHSSTLTFIPSAEHQGTKVTCKVSFANNITTEETVTLNVTCLNQKPVVKIPPLTEGQQATLSCTAPGLCSGSVPNFTWTWQRERANDPLITGNIITFKTEKLSAVTQRHSSTLTFIPSAEHHGTKVTCKVSFANNITAEETVTLNVTYMRQLVITGKETVEEEEALNLTCSVDSVPLSRITWTLPGSNTDQLSNTGSATLFIRNVTTEHSGQYCCTAQHMNTTVIKFADVTVRLFPKIFKSSGCRVQSNVLTCTCITEGSPLPTMRWPLLKNLTEFSLITTVSKLRVNSTVILSGKDHCNTVIECISGNALGQTQQNISVTISPESQDDHYGEVMKIVHWKEITVAFLIGALLSALIFCVVTKCNRIKQRSFGNLDETVEMVTSQENPLIDAGQAAADNHTYYQDAAEEEGKVWTAANADHDLNVGEKDVEYANIDFSAFKRKAQRVSAKNQESTDTEYAEIQVLKVRREECGGEEGEMDREEKEEDEETKPGAMEEEVEDLYSNMQDIVNKIRGSD